MIPAVDSLSDLVVGQVLEVWQLQIISFWAARLSQVRMMLMLVLLLVLLRLLVLTDVSSRRPRWQRTTASCR